MFMINMDRVMSSKTPCKGHVIGALYFDTLPSEEAVRKGAAALAARYARFRSLAVPAPCAVDSHFALYGDFDSAQHVTAHGARDTAGVEALARRCERCRTPTIKIFLTAFLFQARVLCFSCVFSALPL